MGTITGITTASGSGLTGGGTKGTLSLSLTQACGANQTLQWSGSAWVCSSAGAGSVTSVALAAPASDFTVSGSPITSAGTLNLGWTVAPTSANSANAIVKRDGLGNFSTNTVTATAVAAGNISASGSVSGGSGNFGGGVFASTQTDTDFATGILGEQLGVFNATIGVEGFSNSLRGIGVYGNSYSPSLIGSGFGGVVSTGVWGDTSLGGGVGVLATVDNGGAILTISNSQDYANAAFENYATGDIAQVFDAIGPNGNNGLGGLCVIDVNGSLLCNGSKSAVVPADNGTRNIALYAVEAPENWFEDFGSGQLSGGAAIISLEPIFNQTVNTESDYHVFLTPNGDSRGLYVAQKGPTSFEVREQGGAPPT